MATLTNNVQEHTTHHKMNMTDHALANFDSHLQQNPYPGRGIVVGKIKGEEWIQIYWIMGRSENSRNRIFHHESNILRTQAADPKKVEDPSLIIYNAMRELDKCYIVSNGSHTDVIYDAAEARRPLEEALAEEKHEPDAPNFTPRISACLNLHRKKEPLCLSIIKAKPQNTDASERCFFRYDTVPEGYGYGVTTYQSDGNPLPSFQGEPLLFPLQGNAQDIAKTYWNALNKDNRISLAVKSIHPESETSSLIVMNRHSSSHS